MITWIKNMAKKKESEPVVVKEMSLDDFDELTRQIQDFRHPGEGSIDDDSIRIQICSDGSIKIIGYVQQYHDEWIEI